MQLTRADTVKDFQAALEGRIRAISNAHSLLAQSRWEGAEVQSLIREELAPYQVTGTSRVDISGPSLVLKPTSAHSIAMVLHETTTNAVKYGALSVPSGRIRIELSRGDAGMVICWSETGGPPVRRSVIKDSECE